MEMNETQMNSTDSTGLAGGGQRNVPLLFVVDVQIVMKAMMVTNVGYVLIDTLVIP